MSKSKKGRSVSDNAEMEVSASSESDMEEKLEDSETVENIDVESDVPESESEATESIEAMQAEINELKNELLRKQADFENFRKRMFREREEASKYANSKLLLDLVEIIDNFELAIRSSQESQDFASFHEGIELIEKQFLSMLDSKYGLKRFDSNGVEFDPEMHEAIAVDQAGGYDTQTVVEVYQNGYMLHERVLRHAKVKVAMPSSDEPRSETGDTDSTTE